MRYRLDPLSPYGISPEVETKVVQATNGFAVQGKDGAAGVGVPTGGTTNQVLAKKSNSDYDTEWKAVTGGTGTSDHAELSNLDYASAGHTGFQPAGAYLTEETDPVFTAWDKDYADLSNKPTLGTAAAKNIPATGNASASEVVYGSDTRLTDARTPASHGNEAHSATFITAGDIPAIPDSVDDLSPSQTGNNGKFLKTNGTTATWESIPGGGDMLAATYDPAGGAEQVAFASDLGTAAAADTTDFAPALGADDNYVTDAEKSNLHAPGSDNQDLSGLVPYTGASSDVDLGANSADVSSLGVNKDHSADNGIEILNKSGKQGLRIENPAETDISFSTYKTADDYVRFTFLGDGKMEWGSGAVVADTNLYRSGANTLKTDDNFVANNISAGATVSGANTGDQDLSGYALTTRKLDDFGTPDNNTDLDANTTNHGLLLKATAPAAGLINVVGIANGETSYANKALFDATAPSTQAFGDSAATGSATVAARRDHKHAMPAAPTNATTVTIADESSDTSCFPLFATAATGDLGPKSNAGLTFNSSTATLNTDHIGEITGAHGVVIDGMTIKDSLVVGGAAAGVANSSLSTTAGDIGGAWTTWSHSFAGFTNGSETVTAAYTKIGKTVHLKLKAVLGATPSAVTNFTFNLPLTAAAAYTQFSAINGSAAFKDANGGHYLANCYHDSTTQMIIRRLDPANLATATPSTTVPFTWVSGDSVHVSLTYEAA